MATTTDSATVFLVEDDAAVRDSLVLLIEMAGWPVAAFANARDFLAAYDAAAGCLVLDVHLPGMSGTELHETLIENGTSLPTIFLTGHAAEPISDDARSRGVVAVFPKPCDPDQLIDAIASALTQG